MSNGDHQGLKRILVGYDGSEEASRALELAIEMAIRDNTEIHLAYVVQKPPGMADPVPDEALETLRMAGQETLSNAARLVRKNLASPITHLERGNPGERLLALADSLKPNLVVLGSVKHSASERLLGTVSSYFLKSRRYPLLIVP